MDWLTGIIGGAVGIVDDLWVSGDEQLQADAAKAQADAAKAQAAAAAARAESDRLIGDSNVQAAQIAADGKKEMVMYGLIGVGVLGALFIGYQMVKD